MTKLILNLMFALFLSGAFGPLGVDSTGPRLLSVKAHACRSHARGSWRERENPQNMAISTRNRRIVRVTTTRAAPVPPRVSGCGEVIADTDRKKSKAAYG